MKRLAMIVMGLAFAAPAMGATAGERVALSLPDLHGRIQTLAQYRGKWVVVNYWASSCPPCVREIPQLQAFYERHKDRDAVVLGVDFENIKLGWLKDFAASMSMSYPVLRSRPSQPSPFGDIVVLPTTYIVSPAGKLVARQIGPLTAADLDAYLKRKTAADGAKSATQRAGVAAR